MSTEQKKRTKHFGGRIDSQIVDKFHALATSNGVHTVEALRRVLVNAIMENCIPGVDPLGLEQREAAKWGEISGEEGEDPKLKTSATSGDY